MGYVYILSNKKNGTLYIGVTNNLERRLLEHKQKIHKGFASRYNLDTLVWYQEFRSIDDAILMEKTLKGRIRSKKISLIEQENPDWIDLTVGYSK